MPKGRLILIPTTLGAGTITQCLVPALKETISTLTEFIVENEKSARKFLKEAEIATPQQQLTIREYAKHNKDELPSYFKSMEEGRDVGLLSEAGCPAIADPGAEIVLEAHRRNIAVIPYVGANSIIIALMSSGFNGQSFKFSGYLPIDRPDRNAKLIQLEAESAKSNMTQIFIETPFRNNRMLQDLVVTLAPDTLLCIAAGLTTPEQLIQTKKVSAWKKALPELHKIPAVFLIYSGKR